MVKGLVVQADPARETRGLLGLGAGAPPRRAGRGRSGGRPARPPLRARDAAGSPGRAPAAPSLVKIKGNSHLRVAKRGEMGMGICRQARIRADRAEIGEAG